MNCRRTSFGSSMQLLSIENLSLAAEATVVLLLLALNWPQKKIQPAPDIVSGESVNWELVKFYYLQTCVHRGLYLQHWRQTQNRNSTQSAASVPASVPFIPRQIEVQENQSNMPLPWQDRLTHLLNRHGFESVLKTWLSIEPIHRGDSCLSMITLCKYSDMVSTRGAMVTEQVIQRIASHLTVELSGDSLVARYLPDRFVVLHFASRVASCHKAMDCVQHSISEEGFFKVAGESQSLESIVCIVDLHGVSDVASSLDEMEEETFEAVQSGRKIVSKAEGAWTDSPLCTEADTIASPIQPDLGDSKTTVAYKSKAEVVEPSPSNEISAVANADDIAALFAQINSNKTIQSKEAQKLASVSPVANDLVDAPLPGETPTEAVALDLSEVASADDIAALFASLNPTVAATRTQPMAEVDLSEAATADDIASLFATVKSAVEPQELEPPKPSLEAKAPEPSLRAETELYDAASSDDIAALFASMKPGSESLPTKVPLVIKPTVADMVDLSSAFSVDDIEELFNAMKK